LKGLFVSAVTKYDQRAQSIGSLLCVGLDSALDKLPTRFRDEEYPQFAFNRWIIEQTHAYASAYKPNIAFYEARGDIGLYELKLTIDDLRQNHPDIFTICDAKRADIGSTNAGYVAEVFDWLGFDAVTLHPYLGREALQPLLERQDKSCIILCRTSNPGAGELQDLKVDGKPLWQIVAEKVRDDWNASGNCMLVVGATYPDELRRVRELVGDMTLLVPGVGAQGGDAAQVVQAGLNSQGRGLIINAARSIIFADNPAAEAEKLRSEINAAIPTNDF
jgi:orotidine-5'-phosphate decarboxylase